MPFVQLREASFLIVQGHHFALIFAVITTDAERGMLRKLLGQVIALKAERLLCPQQIGTKSLDRLDQKFLPLVPMVFAVISSAVANVKRHHADIRLRLLGRRGRPKTAEERTSNGQNGASNTRDSFHAAIVATATFAARVPPSIAAPRPTVNSHKANAMPKHCPDLGLSTLDLGPTWPLPAEQSSPRFSALPRRHPDRVPPQNRVVHSGSLRQTC